MQVKPGAGRRPHQPGDLCLCPGRNRLDPGRCHLTRQHPVPAHLNPVAWLEARQHGFISHAHTLPQHLKLTGHAVYCTDRAHRRMHHCNAARRKLVTDTHRLHRHHLPDGQVTQGGGDAVDRYRRAGVVMHLDTVDTDAGKTSDHTHNAGPANATLSRTSTSNTWTNGQRLHRRIV